VTDKSIKTITLNYPILTLVQLSDGRLVCAGGNDEQDCSIKFFEKDNFKQETNCLKGHIKSVFTMIQLHDGKLISGSADKTIKIWDIKEYRCIININNIENSITKLIEIRMNVLMSCSRNGEIRVFDVSKNHCVQILNEHEESVNSLIQLKDGRIVSASSDKTIKIFSLK